MISESISKAFLKLIIKNTGQQPEITGISGISGGCINNAVRIKTTLGKYFLKWNDADRYPGMFEAEAKGLKLLEGTGSVRVPAVRGYAQAGDDNFLVLEYIEQETGSANFWEDFGENLARLHKNSSEYFGLSHDNYIGSLRQKNTQSHNWITFFVEQRLEAQLDMARSNNKAGRELSAAFSRLYPRLNEIFPEEPASLLHGDLWSGNFMSGPQGKAVIIDPAVYYGHRYMDLGMSKLFGGFAPEFYNTYNQHYPLEKNWDQGVEIANLYPLMVHVNLFGGGYLGSVMSILKRYA